MARRVLCVIVCFIQVVVILSKKECGRSNLGEEWIRTAAVGPQPVAPGDFPWHSAIYSRTKGGWELRCAGTLVSRRAIITAAHWVTVGCTNCDPVPVSTKNLRVVLGKVNRDFNVEENNTVVRQVSEIRVPEEYRGLEYNYAHDLALVVLKSKVPVSEFVMPVCIDFKGAYQNTVATEGTLGGFVVAWIRFDELYPGESGPEDDSANILQYTSAVLMSPDDCYSTRLVIEPPPVTRDKLCIGGNPARWMFQKGNGGSALTHVFEDRHFVTGISCTKLTAGEETYGTYTNISSHQDWLQDQLTVVETVYKSKKRKGTKNQILQ